MLHFRMNLPFYLCAFYGSIVIAAVLLLRALLKNRLPKFVFPVLWGVALLRLLVPFSLSSPLSLPVPRSLPGLEESFAIHEDTMAWAEEDALQLQSETAGVRAGEADRAESSAVLERPDGIGREIVEEVVMEGSSEYIGNVNTFFSGKNHLAKVLPALYLLGLAAVAGILAWQKITYVKRLKNGLLMEHNETVNELLRGMGMGHEIGRAHV